MELAIVWRLDGERLTRSIAIDGSQLPDLAASVPYEGLDNGTGQWIRRLRRSADASCVGLGNDPPPREAGVSPSAQSDASRNDRECKQKQKREKPARPASPILRGQNAWPRDRLPERRLAGRRRGTLRNRRASPPRPAQSHQQARDAGAQEHQLVQAQQVDFGEVHSSFRARTTAAIAMAPSTEALIIR